MKLKRAGLVKYRGDRRSAFVDVDSPRAPRGVTVNRTLAQIGILQFVVAVGYQRTERGWHVVVKFNRAFTSGELVALQLALGSDPKRERYNLRRVICGAAPRDWNLLFHEKLT